MEQLSRVVRYLRTGAEGVEGEQRRMRGSCRRA